MTTATTHAAITDAVVRHLTSWLAANTGGAAVEVAASWREVKAPDSPHVIVETRRTATQGHAPVGADTGTDGAGDGDTVTESYRLGTYTDEVLVTVHAGSRDQRDVLAQGVEQALRPNAAWSTALTVTLDGGGGAEPGPAYHGATVVLDLVDSQPEDGRRAAWLGDWRHRIRLQTRNGRQLAEQSFPIITTADAVGAGDDTDPTISTSAEPSS